MTTSGEPNNADAMRIKVPLLRSLTNQNHRLLRILERADRFVLHCQIGGQAIFHYERGNSMVLKELSDRRALSIPCESGISSAWKSQNACAIRLHFRRQKHLERGPGNVHHLTHRSQHFFVWRWLRIWNRGVAIERN